MNEVIEKNIEDTSLNGKDSFVKRILKYHYSKRKIEDEVTLLKRELAKANKKLEAYERSGEVKRQGNLEVRKTNKPIPVKTHKRWPMAYNGWAGARK